MTLSEQIDKQFNHINKLFKKYKTKKELNKKGIRKTTTIYKSVIYLNVSNEFKIAYKKLAKEFKAGTATEPRDLDQKLLDLERMLMGLTDNFFGQKKFLNYL